MTHKVPSLLEVPQSKIIPMDKALSEFYLTLTMYELGNPEPYKPFTIKEATEIGALGNILHSRLKVYNAECNVPVALLACRLCGGNPGTLVMYAYAIAKLYNRMKRPVGMSDIANNFPMGFPNKDALSEYWDAQKGNRFNERVDNMLDHPDLLDFGSEENG